jgi:FixJ family two-component response regulator
MPAPLVAIVDDDVESTLILRDFLESKELAAECFADAEALLDARPRRFEAILLDINLPGIWGSECSYQLRTNGYGGPIIAISGNIEFWSADDLRDLGFTCALGKPLNPPQLIALLQQHITGWGTTSSGQRGAEPVNPKGQNS